MTEYKQAIVMRIDLGMSKGKIAAQASHASLSAFLKAWREDKDLCEEWLPHQKKIVLKVESMQALVQLFELVKKEIPAALIKDAGHTQVEPGSITALGIGPAEEAKIDKYTKDLKLL
jgi:peptidyl-tRNA hydrolase, PTH2 family